MTNPRTTEFDVSGTLLLPSMSVHFTRSESLARPCRSSHPPTRATTPLPRSTIYVAHSTSRRAQASLLHDGASQLTTRRSRPCRLGSPNTHTIPGKIRFGFRPGPESAPSPFFPSPPSLVSLSALMLYLHLVISGEQRRTAPAFVCLDECLSSRVQILTQSSSWQGFLE